MQVQGHIKKKDASITFFYLSYNVFSLRGMRLLTVHLVYLLNTEPHLWGLMVITVNMKGDKYSNWLSKQNTSNCFSAWDAILIC